MVKDMSSTQFKAAVSRNGGKFMGFMGYVTFTREDGANISVSRYNFGPNHRAQLAGLLKARDRAFDEFDKRRVA